MTNKWIQKDKYCLVCGKSTIAKVTVKGEVSYELWRDGKQYEGFKTADEAKQKFNKLEIDKC